MTRPKDEAVDQAGDASEAWAVPIDRVAAFTSGAAMAVAVEQIERELQALWRQAAERAQEAGSGLAVVRASLWNLIVHKRGEDALPALKQTIDELSHVVPARVLVLLERHGEGEWGGDDPLRASVEANMRPGPSGRRELVSEEITLEAARLEVARLPALVRSLLLPDLPTAIFLSGLVPDGERLGSLLSEADRLIIDSRQLAQGSLRPMVRALGPLCDGARGIEVADLGWLRTASFRRLVASLFEETPGALAALDEIRIEFAEGAEPAALLLSGWLASRLSFRIDRGDLATGEVALRDGAGRSLRLLFQRTERRTISGIGGVFLRAGDESFHASAAGTPTSPCIELTWPNLPSRALPVRERRDSELLHRALGAFGRDPLLLPALRAALLFIPASAGSSPPAPPLRTAGAGPDLSYS